MQRVVVPKKTDTYADALVAIGIAHLLEGIRRDADADAEVTIRDAGDCYTIEINPAITQNDFCHWQPRPGYPYIQVKSDDQDAPLDAYRYQDYRQQEKEYREYQKRFGSKAKKVKKQIEDQGVEGAVLPPPDDLSIIKTYNAMRMGSNTYNDLYMALNQTPDLMQIVLVKLGLSQEKPSEINTKQVEDAVSILQFFNPVAGKGTHRPKPDSSSLGGYPDKMVDWFEEWMKFRSMHLAMVTYPVGDDTKIMVIAPQNITVRALEKIRNSFLKHKIYGSVWLDIQAIFTLVTTLIEHSREYTGQNGSFAFAGMRPNGVIKGIFNTYFKSLGTASAVMNVSFLALPGWFPIANKDDAQMWIDVIAEHRRCLQCLDEKISGDIPILILYRDFLSTEELMPALEFFVMFGIRFMQLKAQNKWAENFTVHNLRRLFMSDRYNNYNLKEIIENPGFQNIARAIRRATVNAQVRKAVTGKSPFEIQYGLAQQWKRKVKFKDQFIIELADFIHRYNTESARHMELGKEPRALISDQDVKQVIDLIEKYNSSELIGMMLLAFGYAREIKNIETEEGAVES